MKAKDVIAFRELIYMFIDVHGKKEVIKRFNEYIKLKKNGESNNSF